jgi:UDP-sulfoquinovose synthase
MRILILGGDGYLGWPTAMHFSSRGHQVHCVDNYLRRRAVHEQRADSLVPIPDSLPARAAAWQEVTGYEIGVTEGDVCDWDVVERVFQEFQPETIVHYGEMPSAPYSMKSREHAVFTQYNNVIGTLNVLWGIRDLLPDAHLVKLGTLGEYGTPGIAIEEGFIEIVHEGRSDVLPFPKMPGSLYHASKVHDSTNIHQGVVYGVETDEARMDDRFLTRFDYDDVFGTALNRFCLQAVIGHPLTVYGQGGQTRGLINVVDTVQCVELATLNPAESGEYRVFNQFTERFSLLDLAELVQRAGREYGLTVRVDHLENPRVEAEEHYYNPKHTKLLDLGLKPHNLSETLIESMFGVIERYRDRILPDVIMPRTTWAPRTRETSPR